MPVTRILALVWTIALLAAACAGAPAPPAPAGRSPIPALNATQAPGLPSDAAALPDVDADGLHALLASLRGTPVVLNIWGSWCGPCRAEAPHLADAHARWGDRVQFLGLDILDTRESARAFIEEFGWTYPSLFDPSGAGDVRTALGYLGQPVTIFYNAQGRKVSDWEGPISKEALERRIRGIAPPGPGSLPAGSPAGSPAATATPVQVRPPGA